MDAYLQRALEDIESTVGPVPPEALIRRAGDRWSIAETLEHLTLAFTLNRTALEKSLASGQLRARAPRLSERLARLLVVNIGYFPRADAPQGTRPGGSIPPERSLIAIREALQALDGALTLVAGRFGDRVPVANHPYFAGLTVRQWRRFHWRHTRHHMKRLRRRGGLSTRLP